MAAPMGHLTIKFNSIKFNNLGLLLYVTLFSMFYHFILQLACFTSTMLDWFPGGTHIKTYQDVLGHLFHKKSLNIWVLFSTEISLNMGPLFQVFQMFTISFEHLKIVKMDLYFKKNLKLTLKNG